MSCYEWERGEIKIPADQWATFKRTLREAYNAALTRDLALFEEALRQVKTAMKGKRNVNWRAALTAECNKMVTTNPYYGYTAARYEFKLFDLGEILFKVLRRTERIGKDGQKRIIEKLGAVKKKDFPSATSKTVCFEASEGRIVLDDKTHTVIWDVPENNRACEHARSSAMGQVFFEALRRMAWKRNSGGCISGNDEYNRESRAVGGGENLLKDCFGPIGARIHEDQLLRLRGSFRMPRRSRRR